MKSAANRSPQKLALLGFCACLAVACSNTPEGPAPADPTSLRQTPSGPIVGSLDERGAHAWRGLPFASPPVGALRWRAPVVPEPWTETREALDHPAACIQFATPAGGRDGADAGQPTGQEDCLYLNVYAPGFAQDAVPQGEARLPVMFWIHGGGNTIGEVATYNGSHLAQSQDVVVVTTQYRLGPLGWFRHPALRDGQDPVEASGNFGTLDLVRSLEWVKKHIGAFGGDPNNVTIFGESAGGRNVVNLLASPLAKGLFHRAIVQSGSSSTADPQLAEAVAPESETPLMEQTTSQAVMLRWLILKGKATDRDSALKVRQQMSSADLASFARSLTRDEILAGYGEGTGFGMIRMPNVFADGAVLPSEPISEAFAAGHYNQVPVMMGTNRDETKLFTLGNERFFGQWLGFLPRLEDEVGFERETRHQSELWKVRGVDGMAGAIVNEARPPVFAYRWDWDEEGEFLFWDLSKLLGAAHGFEIFFVFGHFELGSIDRLLFHDDNEAGRLELSERMMSYWSQFAYTGDPGRGRKGDLPAWGPWSPGTDDTPRLMILDTDADGGVRMAPTAASLEAVLETIRADERFSSDDERCAFLNETVAGPEQIGSDVLRAEHIREMCPAS